MQTDTQINKDKHAKSQTTQIDKYTPMIHANTNKQKQTNADK